MRPPWKRFNRRIPILAAGALLGCIATLAQSNCQTGTDYDSAPAHFVISAGTVTMPVRAFLLVRKSGQVGAIRLTSIDPAATKYLGKSAYESYFQPDQAGSFLAKKVDHQTGALDIQPTKGVHAVYTHTSGNHDAHVGKWTFHFSYPNLMEMSDSSFWKGYGDHGYEFAPTSACQLSEIDATDKRLRWFRWDKTTQVNLPLSDLPK